MSADQKITAAVRSDDILDYLLTRRSTPIKDLVAPGPDRTQIDTILRAASRVPDHGRLFPWYFIVFEGGARSDAGDILAWAWREENKAAPLARAEAEREKFLRAPVVIAVVSRIRRGKQPVWEQVLSAGAACQTLCMAANAMGFGTCWVTEWYAFNDTVRSELGLDGRDHVAGFIYIGTPAVQPAERERPDTARIVTYWEPGTKVNKGDAYDHTDARWPEAGFDFGGLS